MKEKIEDCMWHELAMEYKESWESAEKDVDALLDENQELRRTISDFRETIAYYDVILKNFREKLFTIINED